MRSHCRSPVCSPKMKVFTWSITQKALSLGENLQSRGNSESNDNAYFLPMQVCKGSIEESTYQISSSHSYFNKLQRSSSRFPEMCLPPTNRNKRRNPPVDMLGSVDGTEHSRLKMQNPITGRDSNKRPTVS